MKKKILTLTSICILTLTVAPSLSAHCGSCGVGEKKEAAKEKHDHAHKIIPGPKGGKIIEVENGHAEFLVLPDRKIAVTFYGEDMKLQAPAQQVVALTAQAPSGNAKVDFDKSTDGFVSKTMLPEGDGYMMVLQIKSKADAKPQNLRIKLDLGHCSGCKRSEYACICEGHNH